MYIICVRSREWEHAVTRNAKANKANQRESRSKNAVKPTTAALRWNRQAGRIKIYCRDNNELWERGGRVDGKKKTGCVAVRAPDKGKTAPRVIKVLSLEVQREQATLTGISRLKSNNQSPAVGDGTEAKTSILGGWQNGHRNRAVCRVERRVCWDGFTARKAVMRSVRVVESSSRDE